METPMARYLHTKGKKLGLPINGTFELTPRCNFHCKMCYVHLTQEEQARRGAELTTEQWLQIGEEAKQAGMVFVLLTGGEPTLRPDFAEIFCKLKEKGLFVSVNSNGLLLNGELLRLFQSNPPTRLNISLYGTSNETYERQCGFPVYERIIENISALRAAGIDVKLSMSVTPDNCEELQSVYKKAEELGAHIQSTPYMFPPVRLHPELRGQNFRLDAEQAGALMAEHETARSSEKTLRKRYEAIKNGSLLPIQADDCVEIEGDTMHCRGGSTTFWVDWDGKMLPCGQMVEPAFDVLQLGFAEAWSKTRAAAASIRLPAQCSHCDIRNICHPCAAMCYCETGSFDGTPEYVCRMRRRYVERMKELCKERFEK